VILLIMLALTAGRSDGQIFNKSTSQEPGHGLFRKGTGKKKEANVKKSNKVNASKRKQEAKEKKKDADYEKFVKKSRQRSYAIQTPEVQTRMKNNLKATEDRNKAKKKKSKSSTRKAGQKYK